MDALQAGEHSYGKHREWKLPQLIQIKEVIWYNEKSISFGIQESVQIPVLPSTTTWVPIGSLVSSLSLLPTDV